MKVEILEKPNVLREATSMLTDVSKHKLGDKINLIKEPEKYGLSKSDIDEKYGEYIEYRSILNDLLYLEIDKLVYIKKYLNLKIDSEDHTFLTKIGINTKIKKIEDYSYKDFKKGALYALFLKSVSDYDNHIVDISNEIEDMLLKDIDLKRILISLNELEISNEKKFLFLEFFSDLENIYIEYIDILRFASEIYIEHYYKVEKMVLDSLENLKVNGEYPRNLEDMEVSKWIHIGDLEDVEGADDTIYYYISTIQYNGLSLIISPEMDIPAIGMEGVLFHDLYNLEEKGEFQVENLKKQISALGDKTRFTIVTMLKDKSYYLAELAEGLGLTSPTVSHHMEVLINNGLIKINTKGRKIYYTLNKEAFIEIGDIFKFIGGELDD